MVADGVEVERDVMVLVAALGHATKDLGGELEVKGAVAQEIVARGPWVEDRRVEVLGQEIDDGLVALAAGGRVLLHELLWPGLDEGL